MFETTLRFLDDLRDHNDREWFTANKSRYETDVQAPARQFVAAMAPVVERFSPHLRAVPSGKGSSVSRMQRDTRFSADKSPYKDWVGFHFSHSTGMGAPGLYLRISGSGSGVGLGVWMLEPPQLAAVRAGIADGPWGPVRAALDRGGFTFIGESLVRVPKPYAADHPFAEDLRRKTFGATRPIDPTLPESALVQATEEAFHAGFPLVQFLCDALDLPL